MLYLTLGRTTVVFLRKQHDSQVFSPAQQQIEVSETEDVRRSIADDKCRVSALNTYQPGGTADPFH